MAQRLRDWPEPIFCRMLQIAPVTNAKMRRFFPKPGLYRPSCLDALEPVRDG